MSGKSAWFYVRNIARKKGEEEIIKVEVTVTMTI